MKIQQFEDKGLGHYSYAVLSECEKQLIIIDPARNPQPYYDYAKVEGAKIVGIIETHPHADFVSGHLEIHRSTGATIYASKLLAGDYPHQPFDEGAILPLGKIKLKALNTPGHSPDSISIVLEHEGKDKAVFTGDTLFIGDVGRPDLRENVGNLKAKRAELAAQLYDSTHNKLMQLADDVTVYPTHGAGSLCGKALSNVPKSTIGVEKRSNYALQAMDKEAFVQLITEGQPFIPKYFGYDVDLNKRGAEDYALSVKAVKILKNADSLEKEVLLIDARPQAAFKSGHFKGAINLQNGGKFETWLGSIVEPQEEFYLLASSEGELYELIGKAAKIGYESKIKAAIYSKGGGESTPQVDLAHFKAHKEAYTIVDIRNASELKQERIFDDALHIPLPELRERANEIPANKPIIVHCAGGYRSAAGSSILQGLLEHVTVYDLGDRVQEFK